MQRGYWKFNEVSATHTKCSPLFFNVIKISEELFKECNFCIMSNFLRQSLKERRVFLLPMMKEMHFCFAGSYCLASRCKLHFPWCHCPSERGLLLLFPSAKPVIAWKRAYETLSHETFVLKITREILMGGFS